MTRYRMILQGEGARPSGKWFGFYATRDYDAATEVEAKALAIAGVEREWANGDGTLRASKVVSCWRPMPWHGRMSAGHTFFNDDAEARQEAWLLETEAANAPRDIGAPH